MTSLNDSEATEYYNRLMKSLEKADSRHPKYPYVTSLKKHLNEKKAYYEDERKHMRRIFDKDKRAAKEEYKDFERMRKQIFAMNGDDNTVNTVDFMNFLKSEYPHVYNRGAEIARFDVILEKIREQRNIVTDNKTVVKFVDELKDELRNLNNPTNSSAMRLKLFKMLASFAKEPTSIFRIVNKGKRKEARGAYLNFQLTGMAGVGKSYLAKNMSKLIEKSFILADGRYNEFGAADFRGQYVGQSAPKTRKLLNSALESIVFIDEAYSLAGVDPKTGKIDSYGKEVTSAIVDHLSKVPGRQMMIVAGYPIEMKKQFMASNEGMPRRFPNKIYLQNYTTKVLLSILKSLTKTTNKEQMLSKDSLNLFATIIETGRSKKITKNVYEEAIETLVNAQAGFVSNFALALREQVALSCRVKKHCLKPCHVLRVLLESAIQMAPISMKSIAARHAGLKNAATDDQYNEIIHSTHKRMLVNSGYDDKEATTVTKGVLNMCFGACPRGGCKPIALTPAPTAKTVQKTNMPRTPKKKRDSQRKKKTSGFYESVNGRRTKKKKTHKKKKKKKSRRRSRRKYSRSKKKLRRRKSKSKKNRQRRK